MDLRLLRYFVVVAEELNFTRAAGRLNMAQPPLSVQIRKLEHEVGAELFQRDNRNVKLTEAGITFLAQARQMLALASQSVDMARRAAQGEIGRISLAFTNPACFLAFPNIIPAFQRARPGVHLSFHDLRIGQQIDRLRRNELDLGFVWLPIPTDEFEVHVLATSPYVALLPADHRLASEPEISVKDLSDEPLVLIQRQLDPESRSQIEDMFRRADAVMNIAYDLETVLSVIGFVSMNCGSGIMPSYVAHIPRDGVIYKPLSSPNFTKKLAVIMRKDAVGLPRLFFDFAKKAQPVVDTTPPSPSRRSKTA